MGERLSRVRPLGCAVREWPGEWTRMVIVFLRSADQASPLPPCTSCCGCIPLNCSSTVRSGALGAPGMPGPE